MTDKESSHHETPFQLDKETASPEKISKWIQTHLKKCEEECSLFVSQASDDLQSTTVRGSRPSSCSGQISPVTEHPPISFDQLELDIISEGTKASNKDEEVSNIEDAGKRRRKFHQSERSRPSLDQSERSSQSERQLCHCGKNWKEHSKTSREKSLRSAQGKWDDTCVTKAPTDAFGEINFVGHGQKISKFVRVDHETSMDDMMYLVQKLWGLQLPDLLISVTGGAKTFIMAPGVKEVFRRGLIKAAQSTGAWIVTGGTNAGVMKHVGEAVHDHTAAHGNKNGLVVLGVVPWGALLDKDVLTDPSGKGQWPADYNSGQVLPSKTCALDPNHTHFILVDDGSQNAYRTEIPFRIKLEARIAAIRHANNSKENPKTRPMIVCVVLEGGPGTLQTVSEGVAKGIPAVIVQGSGRVADILAYAFEISNDGDHESFMSKLKQKLPDWKDADLLKIENIVRKKNYITIFKLGDRQEGNEIDLAILNALLKVNEEKSDQQNINLDLAVTWNRLDIAKKILDSSSKPRPEELDDVAYHVIKIDRPAFVDLLFENGVNPKIFLTRQRLTKLYNEIGKKCLLYKLLKGKKRKQEKEISLAVVGRVITDLLGKSYNTKYLQLEENPKGKATKELVARPQSFVDPLKELFIYSVLLHRKDMAFFFWNEGKESLGLAMLAQNLLKQMKNKSDDMELNKQLDQLIQFFMDLSMELLAECYVSNERKARLMLVRELSFGETTVTRLAIEAQHKELIGHPACQTMLNAVWMGWLRGDNKLWQLFLCTLCPPFSLLLRYGDDRTISMDEKKEPPLLDPPNRISMNQQTSVSEDDTNTGRSCGMDCHIRLKRFFCAPVIKFLYNTIAYLVFLGYYSYVLLGQGLPVVLTLQEYVLIAWIVTLTAEEVRQIIQAHAQSSKSRAASYIMDPWNVLDVVTLLTFFVGVSLRVSAVTAECPKCGSAGHYVMTFNLLTFYCRLLHIFSVHRQLGPKLVMIGNMMKDLMYFLIIVLVFLVGYGMAMHHLLYPNTPLSWSALEKLLQRAFFQFNGEFQLEEATGDPEECPAFEGVVTCPVDSPIPPIVLGVYVLVMNVLMLNLLIAMFSNTYAVVQQNSDVVYKVQRYHVILEFHNRLPLPPPLVILSHLYAIIRFMVRRCCKQCQKSDNWFYVDLEESDEREMILWEAVNVEECLRKKEAVRKQGMEHQMKLNNAEVMKVSEFADQISSRVSELTRRSVITRKDNDLGSEKSTGNPNTGSQENPMSSSKLEVLSQRLLTIEEKIDRIAKVCLKE